MDHTGNQPRHPSFYYDTEAESKLQGSLFSGDPEELSGQAENDLEVNSIIVSIDPSPHHDGDVSNASNGSRCDDAGRSRNCVAQISFPSGSPEEAPQGTNPFLLEGPARAGPCSPAASISSSRSLPSGPPLANVEPGPAPLSPAAASASGSAHSLARHNSLVLGAQALTGVFLLPSAPAAIYRRRDVARKVPACFDSLPPCVNRALRTGLRAAFGISDPNIWVGHPGSSVIHPASPFSKGPPAPPPRRPAVFPGSSPGPPARRGLRGQSPRARKGWASCISTA